MFVIRCSKLTGTKVITAYCHYTQQNNPSLGFYMLLY